MTLAAWIVLVSAPLAMLIIHAMLNRIAFKKLSTQKIAIFSSLAGAVIASCASHLLAPHASLIFLFTISVGVAHVYFHFFNMSETARRIRILVDLYGEKSQQAEEKYSTEAMISVRIDRLEKWGALGREAVGYRALPTLILAISIALNYYEKLLFPKRREGSTTAVPVRVSRQKLS